MLINKKNIAYFHAPKIYILLTIALSFFCFYACSPVGADKITKGKAAVSSSAPTKTQAQPTKKNTKKQNAANASANDASPANKDIKQPKSINKRFSDTLTQKVVIDFKAKESDKKSEREFAYYSEEFNNGKQESACEKLEKLSSDAVLSDSLKAEVGFMMCECSIHNGEIEKAKNILLDLLDQSLPSSTEEKILVRLGQLYCYLKEPELASETFKKFLEKYPNSVFVPLANCESVKQKEKE